MSQRTSLAARGRASLCSQLSGSVRRGRPGPREVDDGQRRRRHRHPATSQARHQVLDPGVMTNQDDSRQLPGQLPQDAEERDAEPAYTRSSSRTGGGTASSAAPVPAQGLPVVLDAHRAGLGRTKCVDPEQRRTLTPILIDAESRRMRTANSLLVRRKKTPTHTLLPYCTGRALTAQVSWSPELIGGRWPASL
jgi:hypothetical protein